MADTPTQLPCTLQWRQLKIRPTRYGIVFVLLLVGMFLGSINYNNNLGFLLTFLLGGMAFVSIAHTYKNIAGLKIISCSAEPVFAGGQAVFKLIIDGSGQNRFGIGFAFRSENAVILDIKAGNNNRVNVGFSEVSRGVFDPGPLLIYSDYPLGLIRVQSERRMDLECIVYPKPIAGSVKTIPEKNLSDGSEGFSGFGTDDFQGLKGYLPGDPLQRISWRASSRGQGLFTKDFNGQYGSSFYLDWHSLKASDDEHKLSLLCHRILTAYQRNLTYGLKLPGCTLAPGNGQIHKNRCLKTLALYTN
ncbi:MAG: DUF58 domain-containing protein [Desulfobacterales bacterium]|nr:MAG: DUF58 domain-containing protein [Desulfobacterales bacterium]